MEAWVDDMKTPRKKTRRNDMKKLILTSMLTAVGLLAQSSGNAPAAQPKSNAAPAAQTPAAGTQTPAKTHHKKKTSKNTGNAATNGNAAASSGSNSTPAPAKK
jgi:hypothetical protein